MSYRIPMGDILLQLRKKKGLRQEDVARFLQVKRQTYCKLEKNQQHPIPEQIAILSDLYQEDMNKYIIEAIPEEYFAEYREYKKHISSPDINNGDKSSDPTKNKKD